MNRYENNFESLQFPTEFSKHQLFKQLDSLELRNQITRGYSTFYFLFLFFQNENW